MAICTPEPGFRPLPSPRVAPGLRGWARGCARVLGRAVATAALTLVAGSALAFDLQFSSVVDVDPAPTSGVLQYTVQIENSGFTAATDVRTVFAIPDGAVVEGGALALPAALNANCSQSGAFVVCTHGDLNGSGSGAGTPPITFVLKFRAPTALPVPPNVRLRGAIGRGAPPLGSAQAGPAPLFAAGSAFWAGDTNENNNAQAPLQQTTLENNADLSVAAAASSNPVISGTRLTYTVAVSNNGPTSNPTTGVRVRSTLPAGATFVAGSASGAGWVFSGPGSGVLTATRGGLSLAVGATATFTYEVVVTIASGTLTNNVEVDTDRGVGGALLDNNPNNNTASVATGITPSADLELTKRVTSGAGPFVAGSTLNFQLAPRNLGQTTATSVVVRDVLPAQHTLPATFPLPPATQAFGSYTCRTNAANQDDQGQADGGRAARSILRCTRASLPVGDVENIDFPVVTGSLASGSITNAASISAATADPNSVNNAGSVTYSVLVDGADIELISFNKLSRLVAAPGGLINNAVRVRNNGPRSADANLQVFVAFGASESLVSVALGWACAIELGGMRCTYTGSYPVATGAISGGSGFPDLGFVTRANAAGTLASQACVGGSGGSAEPSVTGLVVGSVTDNNTANDCSATQGVTASSRISDLVMSKTTSTAVGGDKVVSGSENSATFTLTASNQGPDTTPGVVIQDYLPGHVDGATVVSICGYSGAGSCAPPGASNFPAVIGGWTCTLAAERLICSSGPTVLGLGPANAQTFVVRMSGRLRDSLSSPAFGSCSSNGQFCNQASVDIDPGTPGNSADSDLNNNVAQDTLVVHAAANIQTESKTFSPVQAQVGVDTEYTTNYRNPAASRSDLPTTSAPGAGVPAGVVFVDTFNLGANDAGFVLKSATIVSGAACTVAAVTGGVVAAAGAGGTSYSTLGGAAGTVRVECPAVTMPRNTDRQVRIVVRPNIGALGPLLNTASFRLVDSGNNTVSAAGVNHDLNTDTSAADDTKTASLNFVVGQVDLRVENTDLSDPAPWEAAAVNASPGTSDIVYRVQVRNGGPSLASNVRVDYTITPPTNGVIRFIGDEAGTAVTMQSGATAPQRCAVLAGTNPVLAPATLTLRCSTPGFGFAPNIDGAIVQGTGTTDGALINIRLRFESTPLPLGSTVTTRATVSAAEIELDASNNAEDEVTTVRTSADLFISKTGFTAAVPALPAALPAAVNTVALGQPFHWVLDLVNNGPGDSLSVDRTGTSPLNGTGTVITDTLPAGVTVTGPITWQKTGSGSFPGAVAAGSGTCNLAGLAGLAVTCNVGDVSNSGRVRVTLPVRWDTWPGGTGMLSDPQANNAAASSQTTDPISANNAAVHVVRVTRSSLSGVVFDDRDRAGANSGTPQAPGIDPPLAGVTVVLRATSGFDAYGLPFAPRSTSTDGSGVYRFDSLPAGTYEIVQAQPGGYANSPGDPTAAAAGVSPSLGGSYVVQGAEPAGAPVPAGANSRYTGVVLGVEQDGVRYNFPEVVPSGLISGVVFVDRNRDGSPGSGEPGIAGVTLALYPAGTTCPATGALPGGALQTVTTDSNGVYSFSASMAGTAYVICQQQNTAYGDRAPQPGTGNSTPGANQINVVALGGSGSIANNFPELLATLAGQVFADYSAASAALANNGVRDAGEAGIGSATAGAGVPITLTGTPTAGPNAGLAVTITTHTAADGSYSFNDLFPGTYTLTEGALPAQLGGFTEGINTAGTVTGGGTAGMAGAVGDSAIRGIVLGAGAQGSGNNFAELPPAVRIAGTVYIDANRDGALTAADSGRVSGVTLRLVSGLLCTGTVVGTTTTDVNGAYSFSTGTLTPSNLLIPGAAYSVCQAQPAGLDDGGVNPGAGAAAGGANHIVIAALPLTGSLGNQFGEATPASAPVPDLVVTKALAPAVFTEQNRGSYTLTVRNAGIAASAGVYTVTDTLPAGITAAAAPTGLPVQGAAGWACSVAGQTVTCTSSDAIAAGATNPSTIGINVLVGQGLCSAGYPCSVDNVVSVSGGGEPLAAQPSPADRANPPACTAQATQNACRLATPIQQSGGVSGLVWLDNDHDRRFTPGTDVRLGGFIVELVQAGTLLRTATTDAQGQYQMLGLVPGSDYELRFRDAVTGAYYGRPVSTDPAGGNDPRATGAAGVVPDGALRGFTVPGANAVRVNQNLPLDPSGVVYDSQTRQPVGGALVELLGPGGQRVPPQCVLGGVDSITTSSGPAQANAGTVPGGYGFWLVAPAPPGCPGDGNYTIRVTPPAGYFNAGVPSTGGATGTSSRIPAQPGAVQVPGSCQAYAQGAPCAVQSQALPPSGNQPTPYFFTLALSPNNTAGFVDIVNNHIPLDPLLGARFVISKQASRSTVEVGDAVTYTITVKHLAGEALPDVQVDDRLPAGFRYVPGTFRIGSKLRADPIGAPGPNLRFDAGALATGAQVSFTYVARAGVGAQQGDGINTAQASAGTGAAVVQSNIAKVRVRITGGVFGADACVVGKIYVDCNNNQVQDREELGIPGVRLLLQDGTNITSDSEGKYSLCGLPPRTQVLKADPLTLPRGARLVTSSSRNAGDANSIFIDLKNGELQRADFIEGSCSNTVLEQVKARRTQGEVRAVETEKKGGPALKFESKAPSQPQQGTDSANQQPAVRPRENAPAPRTGSAP